MPRVDEVAAAAAERIHAWLPALKVCRQHAGRFAAAELKRIGSALPSIHIAVSALEQNRPSAATGGRTVEAGFSAVILARVGDGKAADPAAAMAEALARRIPLEQWGAAGADGLGVGPAEQVTARNGFSGPMAEHGVTMWVVEWRQRVALEAVGQSSGPILPSEIYVTFDERQNRPGVDETEAYDPLGSLPRETPGAE